jgi:RNA polymerase sigma-70 factor (ECF subfamily)
MLLHHARRAARGAAGAWVSLDQQDTPSWDQTEIREGRVARRRALARREPGPYQIQAAISALHVESRLRGTPRWREIASLYATLETLVPSPVVTLNRCVAVARAEGPAAGLALLDALAAQRGASLDAYQPFHAARADLLRRLDRRSEAATAYRRALLLTSEDPERRHLATRLAELSS